MFCRFFLPTYVRWVGAQANPWVLPDDVAINILQTIWDSIYLAVPYTVKINDAVFIRVRFFYFFSFEKGRGGCPSNSWL